MHPQTAAKAVFFAALKNNAATCRNGAPYFSDPDLLDGYDKEAVMWVLYDAPAPLKAAEYPAFAAIQALALTEPETTAYQRRRNPYAGFGRMSVDFLCATLGSPPGSARVLFDAITHDARARGADALVLLPDFKSHDALNKLYSERYGMTCKRNAKGVTFECVLALDDVPPIAVPDDVSVPPAPWYGVHPLRVRAT
jgi:hypothetical protein